MVSRSLRRSVVIILALFLAAYAIHYLILFLFIGLGEIMYDPQDDLSRSLASMRSRKQNSLEFYRSKKTDTRIRLLHGTEDVLDLTLTTTDVTGEGIKLLAGLPKLKRLEIYGGYPGINDTALSHLGPMPGLKELVLKNCPITNGGLATLKELADLRHLSINQDHPSLKGLTDEGLSHLEGLTNLSELRLVGSWVSEAAVQHLKKKLPGCQVYRTEKVKWD